MYQRRRKQKEKTKFTSVRLVTEARDLLYQRAKKAGISTRLWFEKAILENKARIIAKNKPHPELRPLLFQANKAGNNINQLAHHFQALRNEHVITTEEYLKALDALHQVQMLFREALDQAR